MTSTDKEKDGSWDIHEFAETFFSLLELVHFGLILIITYLFYRAYQQRSKSKSLKSIGPTPFKRKPL